MKVTITVNSAMLEQTGLTSEQLLQATKNSLANLNHPVSGDAIYFNDVDVTIVTNPSETDDFWMMASKKLRAELASIGVAPTASYEEITGKAGGWFKAYSEKIKVSIIAIMRDIQDA